MRQVLIVSHADADGHVIAEQVRRNLTAIPSFNVSTVVDPERTKDHTTWTKLDMIPEIESKDIVFFVDLMFAPASFSGEADALVEFVLARPETAFFVLDHHPLPLRRLNRAQNLHTVYRPDVFDCTFGFSTHLMVIAALLEKPQATRIGSLVQPDDAALAKGLKRAAAPGASPDGVLAGDKLLALLRHDCWAELEALGRDDPKYHYIPRGRRPTGAPTSSLVKRLVALATELLDSATKPRRRSHRTQPGRTPMSYDFGTAVDQSPPTPHIETADRRDLEAIVTLLELAAICLTTGPDSSFTKQQLLDEARRIGGDDIDLDENDVNIVLGKAGFLRKIGGRLRMK